MYTANVTAAGASWSGESGARIGAMAASSTDHLALSQTLISAMVRTILYPLIVWCKQILYM